MEQNPITEGGFAEPFAGPEPSSTALPRMTIAAFCATDASRDAMQRVAADRRLGRVTTDIQDGGLDAAIKAFTDTATPNVLLVESDHAPSDLVRKLDALAGVCAPDTRVIVIGARNDIQLYRKLINMGVDEYLVGPVSPLPLISILQQMHGDGKPVQSGKVIAVVGAKGGVGASSLAQDIAVTMASRKHGKTLLADFDTRFGSVGLNLDLKPVQGLEKWLARPDDIDAELLERLVAERAEDFDVLTGPSDPLSDFELSPGAAERLTEVARDLYRNVVLDLPTVWSPLVRTALRAADRVVLVAAPELTSLRNAKHLFEQIGAMRPNDDAPLLVLNGCGIPKRKSLDTAKFAETVGAKQYWCVPFDANAFGQSSADGKAILERFPRCKPQKSIDALVGVLGDKTTAKSGLLSLLPGLSRRGAT